jgi:hypothetical protein
MYYRPTALDRSPVTFSRLAPRVMVVYRDQAASSVRKRSVYTRRTTFPGFISSADGAWFHVVHISGGHWIVGWNVGAGSLETGMECGFGFVLSAGEFMGV